MFTEEKMDERVQIEISSIDQLVPADHIVRKIEAAVNFNFIYDLVRDLYSSESGRPSLDPVVLFKLVFIQYLFGIRSMRQTMKEIDMNLAYRWFLHFGLATKVPHFTTFGKNYVRRFKDTEVFEQIFDHVLEQMAQAGLIHADAVFIDATHVKANANKRKLDRVKVAKEARKYQDLLEAEIQQDREANGKKPLHESKKKRSSSKRK